MRRTDREITDRQELLDVMARCDVCRLALNDESGYPYVVPLNFGMEERDGTLYLLFHGAMTGTKYDRMEQDPRATFEMDCGHMLCTDEAKGMCTMPRRASSAAGGSNRSRRRSARRRCSA